MAEIEKIAVYDARIIQDPPKYGVQKGALSVSTSQFQATAASASQVQFQVLVPSLNVFTDRKIELNASPYVYAEAVPSQTIVYDGGGGIAPSTYPAGLYIQPPTTASQCYTIEDQPIPATYPPPGSLPPSTTQFNGGNTACVLPADSWPGLTGSVSTSPIFGDTTLNFTFGVGDITALNTWPDATPTLRGFPAACRPIQNPYYGKTIIPGSYPVNMDVKFQSRLNNQAFQILFAEPQPVEDYYDYDLVLGFKRNVIGTPNPGGNPGFLQSQRIALSGFDPQYFTGRVVNLNGEYIINRVENNLPGSEYDFIRVALRDEIGGGWSYLQPDTGQAYGAKCQLAQPTGLFKPSWIPTPVPVSWKQNVNFVLYDADRGIQIGSSLFSAPYEYSQDTDYVMSIFGTVPFQISGSDALKNAVNLGFKIVTQFSPTDPIIFCENPAIGITNLFEQTAYKVNVSIFLPESAYNTQVGGSTDNYYQSIGSPTDISLGLFPIQSLARTITGTINDCTVSVTGDTFHEQLLISQTRDSLMQRTCASKYDVYAWSADDVRASNGASQGYELSKDSDIPNGSSVITFVNPTTGKPLNQFDAYQYTLPSGAVVTVPVINYRPAFIPIGSNLVGQIMPSSTLTYPNPATPGPGVPLTLPGWPIIPTEVSTPLPIMFTYQSVEPLCLSPLLWQDSKQMTEVGLYGTTNMTVNMTLNGCGASQGYDVATIPVSSTNTVGRQYMDRLTNAAGSYSYMTRQSGINALFGSMRLQPPLNNLGNQTGPWVQVPRLLCTFLTPPPEITLPLVSSVPYVEFPRYNSVASATVTPYGTFQVASNTVTLSSIPDLLVVFVRPAYRGQTQGDTYMPIANIAVTFDNYSNLCNNYTQEDLYACSVAGGLDMDFQQFRGFTRGKHPTLTPSSSGRAGAGLFDTFQATSGNLQTTGSPVLLRMGQDVPLSSGLAPGTLGNYSVQVNLTLDNRSGFFNYLSTGGFSSAASGNVIITIMAVNSGFFESVRGSSAIRKTILNTNDVEAASTSNSVTSSQLVRMVGGASGMHTSSRLTTSMGVPSIKVGHGDERMRKMARHSSMLS